MPTLMPGPTLFHVPGDGWDNPDLIPQSAVERVDAIEVAYLRSWRRRPAEPSRVAA